MMFFPAWAVGNGLVFEIFALPTLNVRFVLAAISALAVCFLMRAVARRMQTANSDHRLAVLVCCLAIEASQQRQSGITTGTGETYHA